ncbi:DNA-binding Lrp family transcriptional regulator [Hoeflea halophila]|uniref:DNA-binding Lrp family transcriptional regulator n=1 Tax=Hoeflea halophila TaxID=714899 RepID=A0A286IB43_9HYPH|nr:Lrp/AsnC family transcriptional regulator [Hoeflea halophila]SOE17363.1 DNA-binding Lrp family transcriptional regulator [Hoeflea halophila]
MTEKVEIQQVDRQVLNALQNDGRMSNQDLAERAGMSASACWRRVKALEEAGVIERYTALVNPEAVGLGFHAMVHVVLSRHQARHVENFIDAVMTRPEVLDCFATTGDADYHLRVRCRDLAAYNAFLEGFMFALEGVSTVKTNLILRQLKHETRVQV